MAPAAGVLMPGENNGKGGHQGRLFYFFGTRLFKSHPPSDIQSRPDLIP
jgi:hypothetical protein